MYPDIDHEIKARRLRWAGHLRQAEESPLRMCDYLIFNFLPNGTRSKEEIKDCRTTFIFSINQKHKSRICVECS